MTIIFRIIFTILYGISLYLLAKYNQFNVITSIVAYSFGYLIGYIGGIDNE